MSRIDELIEELCPEGVRLLPLTSLAKIHRGLTYQKTDEDPSGDVIVLRASNVNQQSNTIDMSEVKSLRSGFQANPRTKLFAGDILLTAASGSRAHVGKVAYVFEELNAHFGGFMMALRANHQVEGRYLFHVLTSNLFRDYLDAALSTSTINNINSAILAGFDVPVPPLEVQREIVSILDKFTQLEAELEAELEARRIQYEVTRDRLLDFSGDLEGHPLRDFVAGSSGSGFSIQPLGDLVRIRNGRDCKHLEAGEFPVFGSGGVMKHVAESFYDKPSVLIPRKGSLGNLFYVDTPFWTVDTIFYTEIGKQLLPKYLFYYLKTVDLAGMNLAGGVPSLTQSTLNKLQIPVPSLDLQKEIVSILDKLEALVNDITIGLPAEIAARRKQYEYYRNKLLTFKEHEAA